MEGKKWHEMEMGWAEGKRSKWGEGAGGKGRDE
jgi:hypothetical protein